MKKLILCCAAVLLMAAAPAPKGYVDDSANIIPDDREAVLEQTLRDYEAKTTIEIAVATRSLRPGYRGVLIELGRTWGVGKRAPTTAFCIDALDEHDYVSRSAAVSKET